MGLKWLTRIRVQFGPRRTNSRVVRKDLRFNRKYDLVVYGLVRAFGSISGSSSTSRGFHGEAAERQVGPEDLIVSECSLADQALPPEVFNSELLIVTGTQRSKLR